MVISHSGRLHRTSMFRSHISLNIDGLGGEGRQYGRLPLALLVRSSFVAYWQKMNLHSDPAGLFLHF